MIILPEPLIFEWDKGNIIKNYEKHNVTNQKAEELFSNEPFIISEDIAHSTKKEKRFQGLGETKLGSMLFISFTIRAEKVRVITVRDLNKKEEVTYETIKKNSKL